MSHILSIPQIPMLYSVEVKDGDIECKAKTSIDVLPSKNQALCKLLTKFKHCKYHN